MNSVQHIPAGLDQNQVEPELEQVTWKRHGIKRHHCIRFTSAKLTFQMLPLYISTVNWKFAKILKKLHAPQLNSECFACISCNHFRLHWNCKWLAKLFKNLVIQLHAEIITTADQVHDESANQNSIKLFLSPPKLQSEENRIAMTKLNGSKKF